MMRLRPGTVYGLAIGLLILGGASLILSGQGKGVSSYGPDLPSARLDINQASLEEWCALPGIGSKLAQRIVTQREQRGKFLCLEELLQVKGLGKHKLDSLRPWLEVSPSPSSVPAALGSADFSPP